MATSPPLTARDHSPLAVLLDPKQDIPQAELDIRLDDYLNDKIQTAADFGGLANLLANVDIQKKQLENQLLDARSKLDEAKKASANHTSLMLAQTKEFERQQDSVQNRLMIVTQSDTPEEATQRLKGPMEKLRRVELARSYVELLKDVDNLTKEARRNLPANPKEALKPYIQLKELAISLAQLQEPAEGAAVHLVNHVQNTSTRLWVEMKKIMADEFESILKKSKWPDVANDPSREWTDCFEKLLDLQAPEIVAAQEPLVLLPMSVLVKTFVLQFKYHFFSDKPTNHPHRLGDYFFEWFLGTVAKWEDFMRENVGPVLAAHFRGNILAGNALYVDPVSAFITALLPIMKEKVDSVVAGVSNEPQYLSRFIGQLMTFDEALRARFGYDGGNLECGWKGLTWGVLDTWFDRWSLVEKDFALERYREIIKSSDSGQIDYDSTGPGKTKTTYGATKVTDLINSVTTQYNKLRRFSHKIRFLISIQAEILDQYVGRLNDSLEVYLSTTTTVGRTLHAISKEEQAKLEGIGGLESLCKVYGSADHVISMLKEWANEEFFIDLWDELQSRAKRASASQDNLAGSMSYTEVKDCTSVAVGSQDEGSVFDVTIENYERLRNKAEKLLTQAISHAFPSIFKLYLSKPQWTTIGDEPTADSSLLMVTPELDHPLQILRQNMTLLNKTLGTPPFRRIWRSSFDSLQDLLYHEVLLKQDFTTLGAARFVQDLIAIQSVVDSIIRLPSGTSLGMPKLREAATLLSLPLEAEEGNLSLKEASEEIFATNPQAEAALNKLGLERLTNYEARQVLQKRVEGSS
ncbi:RINT-1 family protein-like protein [Venustampulla echinocandica]|uniref:RINT-1 family protein-like protein n=1 Tax=Venustampulla echinocandica TaxID=2656787 RepID=A0A370TCC4_9HELO|nr:RINT-1 family protein-like protein [Venustampulla echinocandica]RDL31891.1 RINT-1 family protein-like protein [Venustampulla echinocandica]